MSLKGDNVQAQLMHSLCMASDNKVKLLPPNERIEYVYSQLRFHRFGLDDPVMRHIYSSIPTYKKLLKYNSLLKSVIRETNEELCKLVLSKRTKSIYGLYNYLNIHPNDGNRNIWSPRFRCDGCSLKSGLFDYTLFVCGHLLCDLCKSKKNKCFQCKDNFTKRRWRREVALKNLHYGNKLLENKTEIYYSDNKVVTLYVHEPESKRLGAAMRKYFQHITLEQYFAKEFGHLLTPSYYSNMWTDLDMYQNRYEKITLIIYLVTKSIKV